MNDIVAACAGGPEAPFSVGQKVTPDRRRVPRSVTSQNLIEHFCGQVYPGTVVTVAALTYADGAWTFACEEYPGYYFSPGLFILAEEALQIAE